MPESYRPSNGSEGMEFDAKWCFQCRKDEKYRRDPNNADGCGILADSFLFDVDGKEFPSEWIYDKNGDPCCTAFDQR